MDTGDPRRVALLVIRVSLDPDEAGTFRARITESPDVEESRCTVTVHPDPEAVLDHVEHWLLRVTDAGSDLDPAAD